MTMLSKLDHNRSPVVGSTHGILGLCSLLVRVVGYKVDKYLNLSLGEEIRGLQVEYHRMGRMRVNNKIFRAPRW
jgi:hypothetical protein